VTAANIHAPVYSSARTRQRHIDSLVATYAPLGRRRRRGVLRKRLTALLALSLCIAAGSLILLTDVPIPVWSTSDDQRYTELHDRLTAELSALSAERQELEQYRQMVEERSSELGDQIAAVNAQWSDLEEQRRQFAEQGNLLAGAMSDMDAEQRGLEQRRDPDKMLEQEINAISAQRQALEKRWQQFEAQGELLATEIIAVNAQRRELETQQKLMDRQQKQLQALIDRAIANDDRSRTAAADAKSSEPGGQDFSPEAGQMIAYAGSPAVEDGTLGDMRGGINIGGDLEVALGVTHTGSINGVEQYQNNFVIDDMNGDLSAVDLSNMHSTLIQNGDGNSAAPNAFDSISGAFGSAIQNTLDNQTIATTSIYDISIKNTAGAIQGLAASQALTQSLDLSQ